MDRQEIILNPILTEKSSAIMEGLNKYVFRVNVNANKIQIKTEIEKRFKIKVLNVRTMNFKGKSKNTTIRSGGHVLRSSGKREAWKKAIVTLKDGDKINLVDGDFS
jgi:large subunit ribosomal protein L23